MSDKHTLTLATQVEQSRKVKHLTAATNQQRDQIEQLERDIVSAQKERDKAQRRARELGDELAKAIAWMDRARPVVRAAVSFYKARASITCLEKNVPSYLLTSDKKMTQLYRRGEKTHRTLDQAAYLYLQGR